MEHTEIDEDVDQVRSTDLGGVSFKLCYLVVDGKTMGNAFLKRCSRLPSGAVNSS